MKKYVLIKQTVLCIVKSKDLKGKEYKIIAESDNKPALINYKKNYKK